MGHNTGTRRGTAFAALGAVLLTLLVLASPALAGPPFHSREPARDITGLNHACGAATDSEGDVYASSAGESKIKVFNSSHVELKSITNANEPCGLAVDSKGHLYVSEKATGKVVKYTPNAYPFSAPLSYSGPVTVDSSGNAKGIAVDPSDDRLYVAEGNHVMVYQSDGTSGQNEVQEVSVIASTTGTFTLTFDGQTTAPLAFDATHAQVQAALEGLSTVGAGNVSVTGGPLGSRDHRVTFEGTLASTDVPGLVGNFSGLDFGGASEISTVTTGFAFNGIIGTGELSEATGVAAYTYDSFNEANATHYLEVADNSGDVVKVFAGKPGKAFNTVAFKQTIDGSGTPDGSFGFEPAGAYLAADQASGHFFLYDNAHSVLNEFEATGLYLDQIKLNEASPGYVGAEPTAAAVYPQQDEIQRLTVRATGGTFTLTFKGETTEPLPAGALPTEVEVALSALPAIGAGNISVSANSLSGEVPRNIHFQGTLGKQNVPQITVDGSGLNFGPAAANWGLINLVQGSGPGELYVTSGSSAGAKLFAFSPLTKPDRPAIPSLSRVLAGAKAVAVDSSGDVYVATGSLIKVYDPSGAEIKVGAKGTGIATEKPPVDLAVDSAGRVYAMENPNSGDRATEKVQYYTPAAFPPKAGTLYSSAVTVATGNSFTTNEFLTGLEINSSNSHLFVANLNQIIELDSASKGSTVLNGTFASGVGIPAGIEDVAVNATNGNVYVPVGSGNGAVYVITSGGALISKIGGAGGPRGSFGVAAGMIAVEPSNGHVLVFQNSRGSVEEYEPSGAFVASFGKFNTKIQPVFRIAVDSSGGPNNGDLYVAMDDPTAGVFDLAAFGPLAYSATALAATGSPSDFGVGSVTLNGTVNPRGVELENCHFEHLTDAEYRQNLEAKDPAFEGAEEDACAETPAEIGSGIGGVAVHADLSSLDPEESYRYRLAVTNEFGSSTGDPVLFGPPSITPRPTQPILYTEATLRAEINPSGLATKYHFEYGTVEGEYDQITPTAELAPGENPVAVQAAISGLAEGAEYHFRILAENDDNTAQSLDQSFTTLSPRPEEKECANAEYQTGRSTGLPDCRAYELVTPGETRGALPYAASAVNPGEGFNNWLVTPSGPLAGQSVAYFVDGTLPGFNGTGTFDGYRARRGSGAHPTAGWASELFGPHYAEAEGFGVGQRGVASDHEYSFWKMHSGQVLRTPAGPEPVGQGTLGTDLEALGRFISAGGSHVIFSSSGQLEDEEENEAAPEGTEAVYDRGAGDPTANVVSIKPDGSPFGAGEDATYIGNTQDGNSILFKVGGVLYLRHANEETLEVAESPNAYAGISEDGRHVFYVGAGVSGNTPAPATLYSCDVSAGPCAGPGEHEPTEIAPNSRFVNVSADGSHVYLTSTKVLDEGLEGILGEDNLYVWDEATETIRFVALLEAQDLDPQGFEDLNVNLIQWLTAVGPGTGRAYSATRSTPDGSVLVFQSHGDLTSYEAGGHSEVYRYDTNAAPGQRLSCVSCNPSGVSPSGDTTMESLAFGGVTDSSTIVPNLTDDGKKVFFDSEDRLLPEDANSVKDVYEWEAQGAGACDRTAGCLALISSGQGEEPSFIYGMTPDGHDVFFETQEKLVGADVPGSPSIYDARVGGGIPDPPAEAPCQGDSCQGQGSIPPVLPSPTSTGPGGSNAEPERPAACLKGKRRVKGRCVKKHHKKHHKRSKNRANHNRRTGR